MEQSITGTDVGEEGIAQSLSFVCSLNQSGNVHHIQESGNTTVHVCMCCVCVHAGGGVWGEVKLYIAAW